MEETKRPNVLWVVMDAARVDHLSCYGYKTNTTPNIDKVADESLVFERAYATSNWTPPTHTSMFTGKLPSKHGIFNKTKQDRIKDPVVGTLFSEYETFFCDSMPQLRTIGADKDFKNKLCTTLDISKTDLLFIRSMSRELTGKDSWDTYYKSEKIKQFISTCSKNKKSFFIFVNFNDVHFPYSPPRKYRKFATQRTRSKKIKYLSGERTVKERLLGVMTKNKRKNLATAIKGQANDLTKDDWKALISLYDSELFYLDYVLGQIFNYLKKIKAYDNTIIIITSDHGELFGEHGQPLHGGTDMFYMYGPLLHIPLIIKIPNQDPKRIKSIVSQVDILPTLADLATIRKPPMDGVSLLPTRGIYRNYAISESEKTKSIITEKEHLIVSETTELFDLISDPKEKINIAEKKPAHVAALNEILLKETKKSERLKLSDKLARLKKKGRL